MKDESVRQRTVELSDEGMANLNVTIYNGTSAQCIVSKFTSLISFTSLTI